MLRLYEWTMRLDSNFLVHTGEYLPSFLSYIAQMINDSAHIFKLLYVLAYALKVMTGV